jgi:predicted enzyme related to lactoylglutathione lyase
MKRVMGIGGVFFKARNSKKLSDWYQKHLGIATKEGSMTFAWRSLQNPKREGHTVWAIFPGDSGYFGRKNQQFMINYRVKDLHKTLSVLRKEGVKVAKKTENTTYGKFGWILDGEGNRIELWEPPRKYRAIEGQFPSE